MLDEYLRLRDRQCNIDFRACAPGPWREIARCDSGMNTTWHLPDIIPEPCYQWMSSVSHRHGAHRHNAAPEIVMPHLLVSRRTCLPSRTKQFISSARMVAGKKLAVILAAWTMAFIRSSPEFQNGELLSIETSWSMQPTRSMTRYLIAISERPGRISVSRS